MSETEFVTPSCQVAELCSSKGSTGARGKRQCSEFVQYTELLGSFYKCLIKTEFIVYNESKNVLFEAAHLLICLAGSVQCGVLTTSYFVLSMLSCRYF